MAPPKYRISGCMLSLRPNCWRFDEDAVLRYREMKSCCSQARGQKARDVRRYFSCIFERLTQVRKLSYQIWAEDKGQGSLLEYALKNQVCKIRERSKRKCYQPGEKLVLRQNIGGIVNVIIFVT